MRKILSSLEVGTQKKSSIFTVRTRSKRVIRRRGANDFTPHPPTPKSTNIASLSQERQTRSITQLYSNIKTQPIRFSLLELQIRQRNEVIKTSTPTLTLNPYPQPYTGQFTFLHAVGNTNPQTSHMPIPTNHRISHISLTTGANA